MQKQVYWDSPRTQAHSHWKRAQRKEGKSQRLTAKQSWLSLQRQTSVIFVWLTHFLKLTNLLTKLTKWSSGYYWQAYKCASGTRLSSLSGVSAPRTPWLHLNNLLNLSTQPGAFGPWLCGCVYIILTPGYIPIIHLCIHYTSCQLTQDLRPWANIMCFLFFLIKYYISYYIIQSASVLHSSHSCLCIYITHLVSWLRTFGPEPT